MHKEALEAVGAKLTTVLVSREVSKARVKRDWSVQATTSMQDFLSYGTEAVIVVSPNYLHAEHSIACLHAGKHVLVEKPFATNLEDAQKMLKAAKGANKLLANGLEMRVFTVFEKAKELIDNNEIGQPIHLKLDLFRRPYRTGSGGWKTDPLKMGSSILEEPIHYLDLARWYLLETNGEPKKVQAWANSRKNRNYFNENLDIRLEYASGTSALITRSIAAFEHSVSLQIIGERGSLKAEWRGTMDLDKHPSASLWLHNSGNRDDRAQIMNITQETGHAFDVPRQTKAFINAISKGTRAAATAEDGLASVKLCLAVDASLKTKRSIDL